MIPGAVIKMELSYEAFASEPEYIELNRRFIESALPERVDRVLDLACGTGTLAFLILETMPAAPAIIGIDISRESLALADLQWNRLRKASAASVGFIQGNAENLPLISGTFELVIAGNAIQLFEDKEAAIREVHRVLRRGGAFAFNTSFYARTFVPGTERFYLIWVQEAYRYVADHSRRSVEQKAERARNHRPKRAFSRPWLSSEEYRDLLIRNGFIIRYVNERVVMLTEHSFQSIGSYSGLASVLLPGYPPDLASEALKKSAARALAMVGMEEVPRNWIEFVAIRE